MSIIIVNDIQIKHQEPFYSATSDFLDWLVGQEYNNSSNYLWLNGDQMEVSNPNNKESDLFHKFLRECKFKKVYLLTGNHDAGFQSGNAMIPFQTAHKNVEVIEDYKVIKLDNLNILGMPYIFPHKIDNNSMKNYYQNLPTEISSQEFDLCLYHFDDETIPFAKGKGVDLSYLNIKKRYAGHIHIHFNDNYKGVPVIRRFDESGQTNKILSVDTVTKESVELEVPKFLDYESVEYPNDLVSNWKYPIFNITECTDKKTAQSFYREKYPTASIRSYSIKSNDNVLTEKVDDKKDKTILDFLTEFYNNTELNDEVRELVKLGVI